MNHLAWALLGVNVAAMALITTFILWYLPRQLDAASRKEHSRYEAQLEKIGKSRARRPRAVDVNDSTLCKLMAHVRQIVCDRCPLHGNCPAETVMGRMDTECPMDYWPTVEGGAGCETEIETVKQFGQDGRLRG